MCNILVWKLRYLDSNSITFMCHIVKQGGLVQKNVVFSQLHYLV